MPTAVHFGAGKIGRGFLGQLYSQSGWDTVFVDVVAEVVEALNRRGRYEIELVDDAGTATVAVERVRAIDGRNVEAVADALAGCQLASTAVGVRALRQVATPLAAGLARRAEQSGEPLNVVVCENLLAATEALREAVLDELDDAGRAFVRERVGFVATVVSRMVPDQAATGDPLHVAVEPYATLPVDAGAFVGAPPPIQGMLPVDNIRAHEERKLFCHNLGHALCAYVGYRKGARFIAEAMARPAVRLAVVAGLSETATALIGKHGFDHEEYADHVADLLLRFANRALGDTVARVARDPIRKLGRGDRLVGAALCCLGRDVYPTNIIGGIAAAIAYDEPEDPQALRLRQILRDDGVEAVLTEVCGLQPHEPLHAILRKAITT